MADRPFPALDDLIREVEAKAAKQADLPAVLTAIIRMMAASDADAYMLIGVLLEGAVDVAATAIPKRNSAAIGRAMLTLLRDRLEKRGMIG